MVLLSATWLVVAPENIFHLLFYGVFSLALTYRSALCVPIGGADMPVVISLLNSFTGVAAACGGFLYDNKLMLTGGILVGAAGTLLTMHHVGYEPFVKECVDRFIWCNTTHATAQKAAGNYKEISVSDCAVAMSYARKVMIVPGYGLAVAQAQHVP